jgi:anti-sigma B factor antagonist
MSLAWQSSVWADVSDEQGVLVLRCGGELDEASRPSIEPTLLAAIDSADHVVLDLRELSFCDSAGISLIVAAAEQARRRGCRLAIDNLAPLVRRVFDIAAIGELVELRD